MVVIPHNGQDKLSPQTIRCTLSVMAGWEKLCGSVTPTWVYKCHSYHLTYMQHIRRRMTLLSLGFRDHTRLLTASSLSANFLSLLGPLSLLPRPLKVALPQVSIPEYYCSTHALGDLRQSPDFKHHWHC